MSHLSGNLSDQRVFALFRGKFQRLSFLFFLSTIASIMRIGLPREVKDNEYRVGMVPAGVQALVGDGHQVVVEKGAGEGSGFSDEEFIAAGGDILESADEVFEQAELIIKVKEPVAEEYSRLRSGQVVFGYFHLAPLPEL